MADRPPPHKAPRSQQIVKATTAATFGSSLLVLSGLMLAGTVIGLTIATPLLVIFSPVLVPAGITVILIVAGFLTAAGLCVAAVSVLTWMYRYLTGKRPPGANKLEHWRKEMARKGKEMTELYGQPPRGGAESVQTS